MAQLSLPVQCQNDPEAGNAVIVYGNNTYPMLMPIPTAGVVEAAAPRWSNDVLWVLMTVARTLILLLVEELVLKTIL